MKRLTVKKSIFSKFLERYLRAFLSALFFVAFILIFYSPQEHFGKGFKEGGIAPYDLYSPLDIIVKTEIDQEKLRLDKQKAREGVLEVYDYDASKTEDRIKLAKDFLNQIAIIRTSSEESLPNDAEISRRFSVSLNLVRNLIEIDNFNQIEKSFLELLEQFFPQPLIPYSVKQELLKDNKSKILIRDVGINTITETGVISISTPEEINARMGEYLEKREPGLIKAKGYLEELLKLVIQPNISYNRDITSRFKTEAEERVRPFYKEVDIKKNELILSKGQRITPKEIMIIEQVNKELGNINLIYDIVSVGIIVLLLFILGGLYLRRYEPLIYANLNELFFIEVLVLLAILLTRMVYDKGLSPLLTPIPVVAMLISLLLSGRVAIKVNILVSIMIVFILDLNFKYTLIFLVGGIGGAFLVEKARRRSHVLKGGLGIGLLQFISIFALGVLEQFNLYDLIKEAGLGLLNGIISAFIVLGSLPLFEFFFRLISNITLLELSDTNHPILKDLILKAPGTYHHSLIVGNLAETACEAIGANSLLARVGAYYHDIGKIEKAEYFNENQPHPYSNKHTKLTPELSSMVIINHVKDGLEKARRHKLNHRVVDFIAQHHGTSKVYYFYQRAILRGEEEKEIDETRFRYPGPLPQTNETAIVLLADSVEAASRALDEPNPASIRNLVKKILNDKFVEGQLNECNLTLRDLNKISECFIKVLLGIFHTRIKYPEVVQNGNKGSKNNK
ncbi:MAG: HDIG domain-containing protein [Candidatus Omnitrophica bacterium]|nr:HDIG domain-containing protein [Candidatus Omnitrophota bacterium]